MKALPTLGYDLAIVTGRTEGSSLDPSFRTFLACLLRENEDSPAVSTKSIPTASRAATVDDLTIESLLRTIPFCNRHQQLNVHLVESLEHLNQLDIVVDHIAILVSNDDVTGMRQTEFEACQHLEQIRKYDFWMQRFSVVVFSKGWVSEVPTLGESIPTFVCHTRDPDSIQHVARIIRGRTRNHCPLLAIKL